MWDYFNFQKIIRLYSPIIMFSVYRWETEMKRGTGLSQNILRRGKNDKPGTKTSFDFNLAGWRKVNTLHK